MDKRVDQLWDSKGKDLIKPKVLLAKDIDEKLYFVIEDKGAIVFMVFRNGNITFCIPKTYLKKELNYYYILDNSKLITTSCPGKKNKYEIFVQKYLLPK